MEKWTAYQEERDVDWMVTCDEETDKHCSFALRGGAGTGASAA